MNQPIVITAQEYELLLNMLVQRDPILSLLVQRQAEAQKQAAEHGSEEGPVPTLPII